MTINKYAENLQLEIYWRKNNNNVSSYNVKDTENADDKRIRDEYRKLWLQLIKNNPDKNKTELRKLDSKVYAWLYRNDKKWFDKHTINAPKRCKIGNRIDWKKRDEEILYEVKYTVEVLLSAETKPERITISKVGKKIGKLSLLQNHLDKLPLTDKYIENHMESVEEFQKRRIKWAINELEKEGEEVKGWKVIRKAGIKELYDKHIDYYLKQLID